MIDCNLVFCSDCMHHTPGTEDKKAQTTYQRHGKNIERIETAMKKGCCKGQCKKNLSLKNVLAMCVAFWSISKSAQDSLLLEKNCFGIYFFFVHSVFISFSKSIGNSALGFGACRTTVVRFMAPIYLAMTNLRTVTLILLVHHHPQCLCEKKLHGFCTAARCNS